MVVQVMIAESMATTAAAGTGMAAGVATGGGLDPGEPGRTRGIKVLGPSAGLLALVKAIQNLDFNRYKDNEDFDKDNCTLFPYKDRAKKCPGSDTNAHHAIPDHCWRSGGNAQKLINSQIKNGGPGGLLAQIAAPAVQAMDDTLSSSSSAYYFDNMNKEEGLAICVKGKGKTKTHGKIHAITDAGEAILGANGDPKYTAKLGDMEDLAAGAIAKATGCDEAALKEQMKNYHKGKSLGKDTKIRADPYGKNTTQGLGSDPIFNSRNTGATR